MFNFFFKLIQLIISPIYFTIGSDICDAKIISENEFYKKFKKNKYDKFCKTIFILKKLKNENWIPSVINYNDNLELYTTNCGEILKIKTLPSNWKDQLVYIKKQHKKYNILIKDWGLWDINPYIINNLCIKNNKIYFIDLGDTIHANNKEIEHYFNKKIRAISLIIKYGNYYLPFHYLKRIYIMILRKFQKIYNIVIMLLLFYIYYKN